ncbi:uncharacterized protein BXZ73DRAFT_81076 [Epithele typhae]|uniref:uncharacterized protein n=1 Tax=Epithele typhae TaxID=378194 RepID=UPI0020080302|nr:uncharacterized protein BXZ73DRAFT_81076 [Epithele typhae]KAH9916391.1 hypothetical protein BXZ73DRAFT_81076 [Epithele typhae]
MASRVAEAGPSRRPGPPNARPKGLNTAFIDGKGRRRMNGTPPGSDEESGTAGSGGEFESGSTDDEKESRGVAHPGTPRAASPVSARKSTSWADLDLSIVVALVSPIANWLTGGDHVKNVFLIVLLIFYLHQIIEIPWQLYLSARPRKSARRVAATPTTTTSEFRARVPRTRGTVRHEWLYLGLTVLSPLVGAGFLRSVLNALGDNDAYLGSPPLYRTRLHVPSSASTYWNAKWEAPRRPEARRALRDVCDNLNEAIEELERAAKRSERKHDANRAAQNVRITSLENSLVQVEDRRKRDLAAFEAAGIRIPDGKSFLRQVQCAVVAAIDRVLYLPRALLALGLDDPLDSRSMNGHGGAHLNGNPIHHSRIRSPDREKHLAHLVPRLATIPEAEDSDSDGTFVSDKEGRASPPSLKLDGPVEGASATALGYAQEVMLWPYWASVRVLIAVLPPVKNIVPRDE